MTTTLKKATQRSAHEEAFEIIAQEVERSLRREQALWATALSVKLRAGGLNLLTRGIADFSVPIALTGLDFEDFERNLVVAANFTLSQALERGMRTIAENPSLAAVGLPNLDELIQRAAFVPAPTHPRAIAFIESRAGFLIRGIDSQTRLAIRETLSRAMASGVNPQRAARQMLLNGSMPGLTQRQARAVDNFRRGLLRAGVNPVTAEARAKAYAARSLKFRAETIARTEMLTAANQSLRQSWNQMAEIGLIDRSTAELIWITALDDRTCEICAPMEGQVVGFDATFSSNVLGRPGEPLRQNPRPAVFDTPPAHPRCRCTIGVR